MILPHGHPPDLRWSSWDTRQLRSASASWGYDAVSKPQPVNRPAFSSGESQPGVRDKYGEQHKLLNIGHYRVMMFDFLYGMILEATALTEKAAIVYTSDQVEQIVEMLFLKFTQQAPTVPAVHLDNSISQQPLPGTKMTLSVSEAAKMIGISKPKVYDLVREDQLPGIHVGKKIVIPKQAVIDWLSRGVNNGEETC